MKVMVVEGDAINALSLANELRRAGHAVLGPVSSCAAALQLAKLAEPDLALVDIDLEHKGEGVQVAGQLKLEGILSIFLTSVTDEARLHQSDAVGLMAKPFHPEDIVAVIGVVAEMLLGGSPPPPSVPNALELFQRH